MTLGFNYVMLKQLKPNKLNYSEIKWSNEFDVPAEKNQEKYTLKDLLFRNILNLRWGLN